MDSRTRLLTAIKGQEPDRVPLYCWFFGFTPPKHLRWAQAGKEILHWYTMRLEHIHTLPQPWDLDQDFKRVDRLISVGIDDILEISVPWSIHPSIEIRDWKELPTASEPYTILFREYKTPAGILRHSVRKTDEEQGPGWVIQPDYVPLFEDFNIPRGVEHAFSSPDDIEKLRYLLCDPTNEQMNAFRERMTRTKEFARERGVLVQAWSAFGMDGIVWLCGAEAAIMLAMDNPDLFLELVDLMYDFDKRRTEIMLSIGGVDMIVQRGWYSSTDFWSPKLFRRFVLPHLKDLADMAHQAGILFAYVMTTGLMPMLDELKQANIDLLYFIDPVQDNVDLKDFKQQVDGAFAVAGGINSGVTLGSGDRDEIREAVYSAVETLGPDGGFILSPVDALFPDTPADSLEIMIEAWREVCDYPILGT
jgi:hypothetical protein